MPAPWKPSVTVAAIVERDGRFLLVEEETPEGIRLNQPAGHLDPGESLIDAAVREAPEETSCAFAPEALLGVYMARSTSAYEAVPMTYVRFAVVGTVGEADPALQLEVAGVYHTAALFFDRINRLPRIITVSGLKMGSPKVEQGRIVSQTTFDLVAYAAPQEKPVSGAPPSATAPKVAQVGK